MPVIDLVSNGLTELPTDSEDWASATIIILRDNNIRELNTSQLPVSLEYLDLSDNPGLERIIGDFTGFPGLQDLILANTSIRKLTVLPNTLKELDIRGSPVAKGPATTSVLSDIGEIQRYSDEPLNIYDTMVDTRGPGIPEKSLVMILQKMQSEEDILYRVETLDHGEQVIPKYYLQAYEPLFASEVLRSPHINPENGLPMVYTTNTHAGDILFEKPVPPNCVYVTLEECGINTSSMLISKLLLAFKDEPRGILNMIRDPITYRRELMAHFGRSLHVHWSGAEHPGNRTYLDSIHTPYNGHTFENKCYIAKSGIHNLDTHTDFDLDIRDNIEYLWDIIPNVSCHNITDENLHHIYNDSSFPALNMVGRKLEFVDRPITYDMLNRQMESFKFTQSWAFKMFPGIHYNFSCRGIISHTNPKKRTNARRRLSLEGKLNNIG
ncbi:MAG: leucine-rich repeat domain-containing protein, partial [Alphaproteobacteria bacterium]|nr:leucine-rich repeat domain-containing protein [Alphaproteobacteria bacterium]